MKRTTLSLALIASGVLSPAVFAEHVHLPSMSVSGIASEATPYALPEATLSSPDTGELLKKLPGASVNSNGPITAIAQYRGLFSDRVNVMVDGIRVSQAGPNRMDSPISTLPSTLVESLSLYRGIAPVSSGIETIGGTINVTPKQVIFGNSEAFETNGELNLGYADNGNTRFAGINAAVVNDSHKLQLSGSVDRGDDLEFGDGDIDITEHQRDTLGLLYGFQYGDTQVSLSADHLDTGNTGTPALPMDIVFARGETYKANISHALDNGDSLSIKLHSQDTDHEMSNHLYRNVMDTMKRNALADVDASGIQLHYQHQAWGFGVDIDEATHNTDIINPTNGMFYVNNFNDVERDRRSAFVEYDGALTDNWKVKSGVRVSRVEMDAGTVNTSMTMMGGMMGMNTTALRDSFNASDRSQEDTLLDIAWVMTHALNQNLDVEIGLARKERAPSYQERYLWLPMQSTSGLADGNNHIGNVDLDPETAYQLELGLDWHTPKAAISPRVFYHHINDYIQGTAVPMSNMPAIMVSTMMGGDATPLQFNNVDAKLYGFDTNWFVSLNSDWQLDGTVSYVRGKRRDTSDDLYRIAPLTARTMLSYNQADWRVGIEAVTVAKQRHVSTENEEEKTSGYGLINLSGSYSPNSQVKINAGINNLFDRSYQDHLAGYNRNNTSADIAVGERLYGLGRSAYVNLSLSW